MAREYDMKICGALDMSREVSPGYRDACWLMPDHAGLHSWERCGEGGVTGDPYSDAACQRERGHDGPHRMEWR